MAEEAKIRVDLDTRQAQSKLAGLRGAFEQTTAAVGRTAGAIGQRVGLAGFGALAVTSAALLRPAASDFGAIFGEVTETVGREVSRFFGLRQEAADVRARRSANERTIAAFGIAGAAASDEQIRAVREQFLEIEKRRETARNRIQDVSDQPVLAELGNKMLEEVRSVKEALEGHVTQNATMLEYLGIILSAPGTLVGRYFFGRNE